MQTDPRIPVTILPDGDSLAAWLGADGPAALLTDAAEPLPGFAATERFAPRPAHRFGCACCAGRSAAAVALDRLFQGRARNPAGWFDRVAVFAASVAARQEVAAALREDVLSRARYRPA
ncbi:hypothetical protein [Neoroseomonas soli]|uniref:Uncharacterized protein n=1 Tax=Neoroseomonas soli TaxID=1081025 RepID=A0A9X9X2T7_9PROT|nr:hypothetical protein [Neoroseomonas soli]MBR0673716.1 hypothetical protein [Neoroseomonas soli]